MTAFVLFVAFVHSAFDKADLDAVAFITCTQCPPKRSEWLPPGLIDWWAEGDRRDALKWHVHYVLGGLTIWDYKHSERWYYELPQRDIIYATIDGSRRVHAERMEKWGWK